MSVTEELVQANAQYSDRFDKQGLAMPPARHVAVLTCMDARLVPSRMLGLEEGDAHVIRNAGGRAQDAVRSLVISQRLLGTKEVVVIHHADCGMLSFTSDQLSAKVKEDLGADDGGIDYLPFSEVTQSVRDDVEYLRKSPLIADDVLITGFVYDEQTGGLTEVS
ncbi:MAG: beta-class carbonic anhydrase [Solirubrobacteraceae bacterium]